MSHRIPRPKETSADDGAFAAGLAEILDWAPGFICILSGPDHVVRFVNRNHRRLFQSEGWLGKPARVAFPDVTAQGFHDLLDDVYSRGERHVGTDLPVSYRASEDGEQITLYHDFIYEPIRGPEREVIGIYCEGLDVTAAHEARAELERHTDRQAFRLAVEKALAGTEGVCGVMGAACRLIAARWNARRVVLTEASGQEGLPPICRIFDPATGRVDEAGPEHVPAAHQALAARPARASLCQPITDDCGDQVLRLLVPRVRSDTLIASLAVEGVASAVPDEREVDLLAEVADRMWDAVERARVEAERDRFFDTSLDLLCIASLDDLRIRRASRSFHTILGWDPAELIGMPSMDLVHPDDLAAATDLEWSLERGAELKDFEQRVRHRDGSYRWISWSTSPVPEENLLYGVGRDVTERKLFDRHRETFIIELNHRVKNTLSVVQALATQTFRHLADDPSLAIVTYRQRIAALAIAHDLLSENNWGDVGLREIVESVLKGVGAAGRVTCAGPVVHLSPRQVIALSQALNELAMASTVEGALSGPRGQVEIDWSVADESAFRFAWRETGTRLPRPSAAREVRAQILASLGGEFGGRASLDVDGDALVFRLDGRLRPHDRE
jgi:PAS domain S-box-containing protein